MPRFRRRSTGSKPVHPTKWCAHTPVNYLASSGENVQFDLCTGAEMEEFTNPTIVRIRGEVTAHLIKTDADQAQELHLAWGIRTQDEQVATAGSLLTKNVLEGPWMGLSYAHLWSLIKWEPAVNSAGTVISLQPTTMSVSQITHRHWFVDIKAMRRVPQNTRLVLAWSWAALSGTPECVFTAQLRVLIKE